MADDILKKMVGKGPFAMVDGKPSDHKIWAAEMDDEAEAKFDDYMFAVRLNRLAKEELARREAKTGITMESLMEELNMLEKEGII